MTEPKYGDIVALRGEADNLPDVPNPYYVYADEGMYLHRRLSFGRGLVRWYKGPANLKKLGINQGTFWFDDSARLPAHIMSQAVTFFRRIYEKHHTEAEVIITRKHSDNTYKLFVPTQRVSHGGVYSIYNPSHINRGWDVVGTLHSHCDFGAYHSSTDEGDARDMDGLHLTIGKLLHDPIEIASMVAMNKVFFNYKPEDVADLSDLSSDVAPEWWDRYIVLGEVKDDQRPTWASDEMWDRYMGRYKPPVTAYNRPPTVTPIPQIPAKTAPKWESSSKKLQDDWRKRGLSRESEEFNQRLLQRMGIEDVHSEDWTTREKEDIWEDKLGKDFVDALFDTNLLVEDDLDLAFTNFPESGTEEYWYRVFLDKAETIMEFLNWCDIPLEITKKTDKAPHVGGLI